MVVKLRVKVTGSMACRLWWDQRLVGSRGNELERGWWQGLECMKFQWDGGVVVIGNAKG